MLENGGKIEGFIVDVAPGTKEMDPIGGPGLSIEYHGLKIHFIVDEKCKIYGKLCTITQVNGLMPPDVFNLLNQSCET